jgi:hypothetical protein
VFTHALSRRQAPGFTIDGFELAAIETDIRNNRLNVVLVGLANVVATDSLKERFGSSVSVSFVPSRTTGNACTSNANCGNPLKAGLKLFKNGLFACMSSFVMKSVVNTYFLGTAGHCSNVGNVYQHPNGDAIGSVTHQGWTNNSPVDVSLIGISAGQRSNKLCAGVNCSIVSIRSREDPSLGQEFIGQMTCVARQNSTACGYLQSTNNTISICRPDGTCKTITNLRKASFSTIPGDSGAPVYSLPRAIGVVSASYPGQPANSVYSHIIHVEGYFLMSTMLTPN